MIKISWHKGNMHKHVYKGSLYFFYSLQTAAAKLCRWIVIINPARVIVSRWDGLSAPENGSCGDGRQERQSSIDVTSLWLSDVHLLGVDRLMQLSVSPQASHVWICFSTVWPTALLQTSDEMMQREFLICNFSCYECLLFFPPVQSNARSPRLSGYDAKGFVSGSGK